MGAGMGCGGTDDVGDQPLAQMVTAPCRSAAIRVEGAKFRLDGALKTSLELGDAAGKAINEAIERDAVEGDVSARDHRTVRAPARYDGGRFHVPVPGRGARHKHRPIRWGKPAVLVYREEIDRKSVV